ncbi:adaptor protein MecA [Virgibacillus sp. 179-BFC.A HS]|uniref:Adaptor protein MecA n=1 Tax=Tigheibacillus jepli TaxID=3035914 RepID=A0ABU5CH71_9BACI|nr:adaptor protein MecA [Virgibacillus sp. 179-BFC.A HS]MDY0405681.1 adaptor protein MecA [Virgibacillus sp. 179-BFC.A HS]
MHIIVTQKMEDADWEDDFIEMKVTLDESNELMFSFVDFEDVIQVAHCLAALNIDGGSVYHMNDRYYMLLEKDELHGQKIEDVIAVMSEFSTPSILTSHRLNEYGKSIMNRHAVRQLTTIFG